MRLHPIRHEFFVGLLDELEAKISSLSSILGSASPRISSPISRQVQELALDATRFSSGAFRCSGRAAACSASVREGFGHGH